MKEIKTREELQQALRTQKSVVMYGKPDCIHCNIVRTAIESIERHFPLVDFFFTEEKMFSKERYVDAFPVTIFYENGNEQGRLAGSGKVHLIRKMLDLWFFKE